MTPSDHSPKWKTVLAFAIIYLVWGSTFLAIRIGVRDLPPFLFAAMRFLIAGLALYLWMVAQGERSPTGRQWTSVLLLALLIFVVDYGLLFWAEQRVPSGVAAVMMATIPLFTAVAEIILLGTQKLTVSLALALLVGLGGVAVLMLPSLSLGTTIDRTGAAALIFAAISWSVASSLTRKLPLPPSQVMNSGAQMLAGGMLLILASAALGEFHRFNPSAVSLDAWLALLYLIVPGSIIAFTAHLWLLHRQSPTRVGTYAYVNPVVAVLLGYFLGHEGLGLRTILGTLLVLVSVVVIAMTRAKKRPGPA